MLYLRQREVQERGGRLGDDGGGGLIAGADVYRNPLGFSVTVDCRSLGLDVAFLAVGDYHHHLALNATETAGPQSRQATRLVV